MVKVDFKLQDKELYAAPVKEPVIVQVPAMLFLMIDGRGDPNHSPEYQAAVQSLYSLSYTFKFRIKKNGGADFAVAPLEGLWWVEDLSQLSMIERGNWKWTMMIRQPETVTAAFLVEGIVDVLRKKGLEAVELVRLEWFEEGKAAQIMHIGPYAAEAPTLNRLHRYVEDAGLRLRGKHHEIYLGDPNRTAPDKLKTVLRHPVEQV